MFTLKNLKRRSKEGHVEKAKSIVYLPKPEYFGEYSVEEALSKRRSVRNYKDESVRLKDISQLLWAAQGITGDESKRTAPSAGALYPLQIYLVSANVEGLSEGVYHYDPENQTLSQIAEGDKRKQLSAAALMQGSIRHCAAVLIFAADFKRVTSKYFEKGRRYVYMETGHAAQNVFLQAVSLHIGTVTMGAFLDGPVKKILHLPRNQETLYLMPVGKI
jgi:SagB-type dehydrogenase family enzyme